LRRTRDAFARSGAQSLRARGLERLQRDEVTAVAVHFHSLDADGNLAAAASATVLRDAPDLRDALLVAFVRREQGLVLPPGNPKRLRGLSDVLALGARMAMRQRSYFRPTMLAWIRFLGEKRLRQRAEELTGYDPSPAGQIRFAA
jgi:molybdate-binding protein